MRILFLLLWLIAYPGFAAAQIECGESDYQKMKQDYQTEFQATRFEKAQAILLAAQNCKEADQKWIATELDLVVAGIAAQRDNAEKQKLTAYANDLAYKSQIALRDGDRTTAFRLAEFAHRYVDDDNLQVTSALCYALYYNDNPDQLPLPWASNLQGHTSQVNSVAFSPDGKRLATGAADHTVKIWDFATGKDVLTLQGHTSQVTSVAFSPDGKRLATGAWDTAAKIWDLATGKELLTLQGHNGLIESIAFSPDGKRLAAGANNTAKIWDLATGEGLLTLQGHTSQVNSVAFSPDGKRLATGSLDATAKVWDLATGKELLTLKGHNK